MLEAPCTTWRFVRTSPEEVTSMPVPAAWACWPADPITVLMSTTAGMILFATAWTSKDWLPWPVDEPSWGTAWIGLCAEGRGAKMLPVRVTLQALISSSPTIVSAASSDQPRRDAPPAGLISLPPFPSSIWWMVHSASKWRVREALSFVENSVSSGFECGEEAVKVLFVVVAVEGQPQAALPNSGDDPSLLERLLQSIGLDPIVLQREDARALTVST